MKILICGGRNFTNINFIYNVLNKAKEKYKTFSVIQGGANGADYIAKTWAIENNFTVIEYKADWDTHGKSAGMIRNNQMLHENPDLIIAFPGGNGTRHMKTIGKKANIKIIEFN